MAKIQSVEPNIADLANGWLKSYKLDYKLEQESLNTEIDQALNDYYSKNGGVGGNRPDAKLLLQDKNLVNYPILIEYKGYKDKLVKLDVDGKVANKTAKNQPDFKNINSYAVNGAVHYANALLHYTSYTDIIAIGMTGYKNDAGKLEYEIGVYYVSKSNFGVGQKVDDFTDLSFLKKSNFDAFIEKVKQLQLSPCPFHSIPASIHLDLAGFGKCEPGFAEPEWLCKRDHLTLTLVHSDSSGFKSPYNFMPKFLQFFHIGQDHIVIIHVMTGTVNTGLTFDPVINSAGHRNHFLL